jgi:hypothetical protein
MHSTQSQEVTPTAEEQTNISTLHLGQLCLCPCDAKKWKARMAIKANHVHERMEQIQVKGHVATTYMHRQTYKQLRP